MGIVFGIILCEVFLRLSPVMKGNVISFQEVFGDRRDSMLWYMNNDARHKACFQPSSLLGYEHVPNSSFGEDFTVNSYGMIGKEYELEKEEGVFRVLLLGDSVAAQDYASSFLEGYLNADPDLNLKNKFQLWNAGVGGYDVRRYALYLQHKGLHYKPDMVLVFLFLNDFYLDSLVYYKGTDGMEAYCFKEGGFVPATAVNPLLLRYSYLYRLLLVRGSYWLDKGRADIGRKIAEDGRYYLSRIKQVCEKNKLPLFVVVFPYLMPMDSYSKWKLHEYKTACKVLKETGINYLDLYESLQGRDLRSLRNTSDDPVHPGREGHHIIAGIIYKYLAESYFYKQAG